MIFGDGGDIDSGNDDDVGGRNKIKKNNEITHISQQMQRAF